MEVRKKHIKCIEDHNEDAICYAYVERKKLYSALRSLKSIDMRDAILGNDPDLENAKKLIIEADSSNNKSLDHDLNERDVINNYTGISMPNKKMKEAAI